MSYSSEVLADAPVVYLKLDETAGTTAADSSGNGRSATNSTGVTPGQASLLGDGSGHSARYNGTTGDTSTPYAAWMDVSAITVECRITPDAASLSGTRIIAGRWGPNNVHAWLFNLENGKLRAGLFTGSDTFLTGATSFVAGTTYTVAFTYDGTTLRVYVNGAQDGSLSVPGAQIAKAVALHLGTADVVIGNTAFYFAGLIDEFSITPSALSASRLLARHNAATSASVSIPGETFAGTATALDGAALADISLAGDPFTSAATMLGGTVPGATAIAVVGEAFASAAAFLGGTVATPGVVSSATDTYNLANGRARTGTGSDLTTYPVLQEPPSLSVARIRRMAQSAPPPTLTNGRPA